MNSYGKCLFVCGAAPIPTLVPHPTFQPTKQTERHLLRSDLS